MTSQDPYHPQLQPPPAPVHQAHMQPVQPGPPVYGHPQPYPQAPPFYAAHPYWSAPAPVTIDGFAIVQPRLKPIPSGPAVGSLVAGIGAVLGAVPGLLFAAFSPLAGLTFFMSAALFGLGSLFLAIYARRQIRAAQGGVSGKGVALTGLIIAIVALAFAAIVGLISLAATM
ncbi:DUF4190 domain-containing protein [Glycomyces terrestris]|uniref:DUF4190 domain-containing protein n=1 Tax=Glycomyces terrestris TaxID=2493553 RepID=A0A426UU55_9ACTN|nr:DUF4190 domain-containing protein [Glycomyces terrestris]RRR97518.1 hypothetical protein EIW28_19165 [Glycomyces terrestris]